MRGFVCAVLLAFTATGLAQAQQAVTNTSGPDPRETVNVCDVYGRGFFYIPGSLTCLKVDGYVRYQYTVVDEQENAEGDDYTAGSRARAVLDFDAREETDAGLLRGFVRVEATNLFGTAAGSTSSGSSEFEMRDAFIQYGNLTAGRLYSLWTSPTAGIRDGLTTVEDWAVGNYRTNQLTYTQTFGKVSVGFSAEDDASGDAVPNLVGKLVYADTWGGAYIAGAYEDEYRNTEPLQLDDALVNPELLFSDPRALGDEAFTVKGGISLVDLVVPESLFKVEGHYAFEPSIYSSNNLVESFGTAGVQDDSNQFPIEWAVGVGYSQAVGRFAFAASAQYGRTFEFFSNQTGGLIGDADFFNTAVDLSYQITTNLSVLGEVTHREVDFPTDDFSQTAGFVRLDRRF